MIKGQAFGGYIDAKSGKRLIYEVVVNNVPVKQLMDLLEIFQDQGPCRRFCGGITKPFLWCSCSRPARINLQPCPITPLPSCMQIPDGGNFRVSKGPKYSQHMS